MAADERSSPDAPRPASAADSVRTEDLSETTERLDSLGWEGSRADRFADEGEEDDGVGMIHGFLEEQLRLRPLPTLLAALAAGWVVGKLLR